MEIISENPPAEEILQALTEGLTQASGKKRAPFDDQNWKIFDEIDQKYGHETIQKVWEQASTTEKDAVLFCAPSVGRVSAISGFLGESREQTMLNVCKYNLKTLCGPEVNA